MMMVMNLVRMITAPQGHAKLFCALYRTVKCFVPYLRSWALHPASPWQLLICRIQLEGDDEVIGHRGFIYPSKRFPHAPGTDYYSPIVFSSSDDDYNYYYTVLEIFATYTVNISEDSGYI
jgi:hypothetical protein